MGGPFSGSSRKREVETLRSQVEELSGKLSHRDSRIEELQEQLLRSQQREDSGSGELIEQLQRELRENQLQIQALKARLRLAGGGEEIPQVVTRLQRALELAKAKLIEQQQLLAQLTARPLPYATVLEVVSKEKRVKLDPKDHEYSPEDFYVGARVRLDPDSEFKYQSGNTDGELTHFKHPDSEIGWVRVRWDRGSENNYRIGLPEVDEGIRDLLLVEIEDKKDEVRVVPSKVVILMESRRFEVEYPTDDIDVSELRPGASVKINSETMQIVDVVANQDAGEVATVKRLVDERTCEVDHNGIIRLVYTGEIEAGLEKGDRVAIDVTFQVIVRNLGKDDDQYLVQSDVNVSWDDIGGLEHAISEMREAIETPYKHPEVYSFYGKKPLKGILLEGPPGNGKTMLAKAAARSLMDIYGTDRVPSGFIYVKGPEILNPYVGVIEQTIRQLFRRARKHQEEHGFPAVIFIDEAEAILYKRGSGRSSDIERTTVPMFLAEMDGLDESGAIVILATNRASLLDPAVVRDGRVDRKIHVPRPDRITANKVFQLHLQGKPLSNGYTREDLASLAVKELFSEQRAYYNVRLNGRHQGTTLPFTLAQISSGAMIAGIVDRATSIAMHRDISSGDMDGLSRDDILKAIDLVFEENLKLSHEEALAEFTEEYQGEVAAITPVVRGSHAN